MAFCHVIKSGPIPPVREVKEVPGPRCVCGHPELVADKDRIREAAKAGIKRRTLRVKSNLP